MFVGWSNRASCSAAMGGGGWLVVRYDSNDSSDDQALWMIHELAHAYLGAPDYYQNRSCFSGDVSNALLDTDIRGFRSWEFSQRGKDSARYLGANGQPNTRRVVLGAIVGKLATEGTELAALGHRT